jgi:hypothetical protein
VRRARAPSSGSRSRRRWGSPQAERVETSAKAAPIRRRSNPGNGVAPLGSTSTVRSIAPSRSTRSRRAAARAAIWGGGSALSRRATLGSPARKLRPAAMPARPRPRRSASAIGPRSSTSTAQALSIGLAKLPRFGYVSGQQAGPKVLEVLVEGAAGDSGQLGHPGCRKTAVALLRERCCGRLEQPQALVGPDQVRRDSVAAWRETQRRRGFAFGRLGERGAGDQSQLGHSSAS